MRKSQFLALVAIFASINVVSDSFMSLPEFPSGVWYSWIFLVEALTGIVLGPFAGFAATFIGVMIGHYIYFIDAYEFLFTVGAAIGAMFSASLFRGKWKLALVYYTALFVAYFVTPIAWQLPIWGMWDTYLAYAVLIATILMIRKGLWKHESKRLPLVLAISAFIGLEADVLFRIFIFVPCQMYQIFYGFGAEALQLIWIVGAVGTPIKAALSTLFTVVVGHPLVKILKKANLFDDSMDSQLKFSINKLSCRSSFFQRRTSRFFFNYDGADWFSLFDDDSWQG